jgi:hypothetical protein
MNLRAASIDEARDDERPSLLRDRRGAVLAEFVIVFIPLMTVFMSSVQWARVATAHLVAKHATVSGARAAAVTTKGSDGKSNPGAKDNEKDDVERAVKFAMGPWYYQGFLNVEKVDIKDESSQSDPYGLVTVTVTANYKCDVPIGKYVVCGADRTMRYKPMRAAFPHQGARYKDD